MANARGSGSRLSCAHSDVRLPPCVDVEEAFGPCSSWTIVSRQLLITEVGLTVRKLITFGAEVGLVVLTVLLSLCLAH